MKIPNSLQKTVAKISNVKHLHCEVEDRLHPKLDPTRGIDKAAGAESDKKRDNINAWPYPTSSAKGGFQITSHPRAVG